MLFATLLIYFLSNTVKPEVQDILQRAHWGRDNMAAILQTIISNAFSSKIIIAIPLNYVPMGPINNKPALDQIMTWCRIGAKPLSEPMMS